MTILEWNAPGTRYFETGVSNGVLYVSSNPGVPWNGLVSVVENPTGGTEDPYYIDGVKYYVRSALEEYTATLQAFYYPDEFEVCIGYQQLYDGFMITQQRHTEFGLTYKTLLGNDLEGQDHGYKLHLVYNITAEPAVKNYNSVSNVVDLQPFSWTLHARPNMLVGSQPTAHIILDSTEVHPELMASVEDILYGNSILTSRLPSMAELTGIFTSFIPGVIDARTPSSPYYDVIEASFSPGITVIEGAL